MMISIVIATCLCLPFIAMSAAIVIDEIGFYRYWRKEMRRVLEQL